MDYTMEDIFLKPFMIEKAESNQLFQPFIVNKIVTENKLVNSFYLIPEDKHILPKYSAGQYITCKLNLPNQSECIYRNYSLSGNPYFRDHYKITVKRINNNDFCADNNASNYFHKYVQLSSRLWISPPCGNFYLKSDEKTDIVLLSVGVGITPIICMLNYLTHTEVKQNIWFIHGTANSDEHLMREHIQQIERNNKTHVKVHICYSQPKSYDVLGYHYHNKGYLTLKLLQDLQICSNSDFYLCGSNMFIETLTTDLIEWGVSKKKVFYELFS